jgi:hypothetical protein
MQADKIRLVTFAVLGLFAFRTITHAARMKREDREDKEEHDAALDSRVNEKRE